MKISDFMDLKLLQKIQDSFSNATGLAAIVVDTDGNYLTEGSNFTDFCMRLTRGTEEGKRRCLKCDEECKGTYFCHAGLMDFAADIEVNGVRLGSVIGGQILPNEPNEDKFRAIAQDLGINEDEYIAALSKIQIRDEATIRAAADLLNTVVNTVVNMEYTKSVTNAKLNVMETEVQNSVQLIRDVMHNTKKLESISAKQNILALNSSIEAARFGNSAAGFSVLAKQTGDLSKQSADLYKQINESVQKIADSIQTMEDA